MGESHLRVFPDRSELIHADGSHELFLEGTQTREARQRYQRIEETLANGYLEEQIFICRDLNGLERAYYRLADEHRLLLESLVDGMTSEVGRALVGITILQLCIKSVEPAQSIRLHKGSATSNNFSWKDGISMRSLDKRFITPKLRQYDLLRVNADGIMMTRSLAENYPYSVVYKANMRGAKHEWVQIIDLADALVTDPEAALRYLITLLLNRASQFLSSAESMLRSLQAFGKDASATQIRNLILEHVNSSDHAARLLEIAMHSLMQAMFECGAYPGDELVPLSQMRSANKKHGNIGDVEIRRDFKIIESWDAKYGKTYLRDELEELAEKLPMHSDVELAGFVTSSAPDRLHELLPRIADIEAIAGTAIEIKSVDEWLHEHVSKLELEERATDLEVSRKWLRAYGESLAQKRRHTAPIDEPCHEWVNSLASLVEYTG